MGPLILGALALLFVLLLLRGFVGADPRLLVRSLRFFAAGLLLLAAIGFAFFDRVGLAMLAGSFAWAMFTGGQVWHIGWPRGIPRPGGAGPQGKSAGSTRVATDWVEMMLDHNSGAMSGRVLKGRFAGKSLDALSKDDSVDFYVEASPGDTETANLLATYLDRRFGADWRAQAQRADQSTRENHARPDSGMSRNEAYAVLGLRPGADEDAIRAAHRKLMLKNHPDVGGSSEVAARINEAKDVLLRE
jgi:DnaJ domain